MKNSGRNLCNKCGCLWLHPVNPIIFIGQSQVTSFSPLHPSCAQLTLTTRIVDLLAAHS
ncbi:hypothetical protein TSMEX_006980 [Taenia solium]|eukprot:TsM_000202100 transcript=TsM_000202100 gene=TsM_000202100